MQQMDCPDQPAGLTLLELQVVTAIIGVLIALAAPAVQKARNGAVRAACGNNLKQVGLAIHQYQNAYGALPPSQAAPHFVTWAVLILPFLEQESVYRLWDLELRYQEQPNASPPEGPCLPNDPSPHNVKSFFCPTRRSTDVGCSRNEIPPSRFDYVAGLQPRAGGLSDYAACSGSNKLNGALVVGMNCKGGGKGHSGAERGHSSIRQAESGYSSIICSLIHFAQAWGKRTNMAGP